MLARPSQLVQYQPTHRAALWFLGLLLFQGGHELEHVVQVIQRYVLGNPKGAGILGSWINIEPVHLTYNGLFLAFIALCFWQGRLLGNLIQHHPVAFWLMTFALLFETYHFVEHIVKMAQFLETGINGTPGILGHFVNIVWLHFTYNTIAYVPLLAVFFMDGYHKSAANALRPTLRR